MAAVENMSGLAPPKVTPTLRPEDREALNIDRKRQLEETRRTRILDPKQRTIGVDVPSLEKQIQEKKFADDLEKARQKYMDEQLVLADKHMNYNEFVKQRAARQKAQEVNEFRKQHQLPHGTKEWDLNDPLALRNDQPPRAEGSDAPVSSAQQFEGEDRQSLERKRAQQQQQRDWIAQQLYEKQAQYEREAEDNALTDETEKELNFLKYQLEVHQEEVRRAMKVATREFNQALDQETQDRRRQTLINEVNDNLDDIRNHLESDFLNENRATTVNAYNPNRYIPYNFKGLDQDHIQHIRDTQRAQVGDYKLRQQFEKEEEDLWHKQEEANRKLALRKERENERSRKQKALEYQAELKRQMEESKNMARQRDQVYANQVDQSFFNQFGTSSR